MNAATNIERARVEGTSVSWFKRGDWTHLRENARRMALPEEDVARAVDLYTREKMSSHEIGATLGRSSSAILKALKVAGVARTRGEGKVVAAERGLLSRIGAKHDFFQPERFTPEAAWALGLIFGDGWLQGNGVGISGSEEVVTKARDMLAPKATVSKTPTCHVVQVTSVPMLATLRSAYGLTECKSRTMRFPAVPMAFLPHFVRGLWDSDGSLYWSRVVNKYGSVYNYLCAAYASASREFVVELARVLTECAQMRLRPVETQLRGPFTCCVVRYAESDTLKLCEWMYADSEEHMRCSKRYGLYQDLLRKETRHR